MKNIPILLLLIVFACSPQNEKSIEGVYMAEQDDVNQWWILVDGYASKIYFKDDEYISSEGGTFTFDQNTLKIQTEFNDADPSLIGRSSSFELKFSGNNFQDENGLKWKKQPPKSQQLDGLWKIAGRQNKDEFVKIDHSGSRKTIKLLKDGFFQWIAIEPEEKKFFGTGGGKYTFKNGIYTEEIYFFSRDNSRIGAKLNFEGEIIDGEWHHQGKSSKGDPIHEIWIKP